MQENLIAKDWGAVNEEKKKEIFYLLDQPFVGSALQEAD